METRRWVNQSQPQTLYIATFLFYFDAVLIAISGGLFSPIGLILIAGFVGSAYGIANEMKLGYWGGLIFSGLGLYPYVNNFLRGGSIFADPLGLMFAVALFALLVHPMSREYQRIWFK